MRLTVVSLAAAALAGCAGSPESDTADFVWNEFSDFGKESACGAWSSGDLELQLRFLKEIRFSDPDNLPEMSQDEYEDAVLQALERYC